VLVLTRKKGQSMMIGHNIELSIIDIQGDQVRIGISAPTNIVIHRKEIYEEIRKENLSAAADRKIDITELNRRFKRDSNVSKTQKDNNPEQET
jgi:carbon storage regulator